MFCTSDNNMLVYSCGLLRCFCVPVDVNRRCWCVMSKGMHAVGQPEVVILLQCLPEEKRFPTDIFNHFIQIYWDAQTGDTCIRCYSTIKLRSNISNDLINLDFAVSPSSRKASESPKSLFGIPGVSG